MNVAISAFVARCDKEEPITEEDIDRLSTSLSMTREQFSEAVLMFVAEAFQRGDLTFDTGCNVARRLWVLSRFWLVGRAREVLSAFEEAELYEDEPSRSKAIELGTRPQLAAILRGEDDATRCEPYLCGTVAEAWARCLPLWAARGRVTDFPRGVRHTHHFPCFETRLGHHFVARFRNDYPFLLERLERGSELEIACAFDLLDFLVRDLSGTFAPLPRALRTCALPLPAHIKAEVAHDWIYRNHGLDTVGKLLEFEHRGQEPVPKDNPDSWREIREFIDLPSNNDHWSKWQPMARDVVSALEARGFASLFRIEKSMDYLILSTSEHYGLVSEPRVTLQFLPDEQIVRVAYGCANLHFDKPLSEERVASSVAVPSVLRYVRRLWSETKPDTRIPDALNGCE